MLQTVIFVGTCTHSWRNIKIGLTPMKKAPYRKQCGDHWVYYILHVCLALSTDSATEPLNVTVHVTVHTMWLFLRCNWNSDTILYDSIQLYTMRNQQSMTIKSIKVRRIIEVAEITLWLALTWGTIHFLYFLYTVSTYLLSKKNFRSFPIFMSSGNLVCVIMKLLLFRPRDH